MRPPRAARSVVPNPGSGRYGHSPGKDESKRNQNFKGTDSAGPALAGDGESVYPAGPRGAGSAGPGRSTGRLRQVGREFSPCAQRGIARLLPFG
ncbi:hypothetical protein SDC9_135695 [bioreactor metagenome]|uniref:Uncharacterized protein n=1 Tax=bioreactor metagenome TaxID=1076179 RepID=A0A645DH69_9ZZZZ